MLSGHKLESSTCTTSGTISHFIFQVAPTTPANEKSGEPNNKENVMSVPSRDIRVKSPDCRRLQKASSSADDSSFSKSQSSSINSLDQVWVA